MYSINCYYGWFRIYLLMNGTDWPWVALDKKAYCTIPNYPLRWGQTNFTDKSGRKFVWKLVKE